MYVGAGETGNLNVMCCVITYRQVNLLWKKMSKIFTLMCVGKKIKYIQYEFSAQHRYTTNIILVYGVKYTKD